MKPIKEICFDSTIKVFNDISTFTEKEQQLINKAHASVEKAYAPYSNFKVGCAVLLKNGEIIRGNNQENAVFPLGLCAERVALFNAGSNFPDVPVVALALATQKPLKPDELPPFPCGSCRQAMVEAETRYGNDIKIMVCDNEGNVYVMDSIKEILPFPFSNEDLK